MGKQTFGQPSLSIPEQLSLLKQRNLIINDTWASEHFLKTIGYYRLKAYFKPFLLSNNSNDGFRTGTTFSDILNLYIFDRELRLLIVDAVERIEVALRTSLSNAMSKKYGPHWYLDQALFSNTRLHEIFTKEVAVDYTPPHNFSPFSKTGKMIRSGRYEKHVHFQSNIPKSNWSQAL